MILTSSIGNMDIKNFVINGNGVRFRYYKAGFFYYDVYDLSDGEEYFFPVPLDEIGEATFLATDRAMLFMRYIRKAIEDGTLIKAK